MQGDSWLVGLYPGLRSVYESTAPQPQPSFIKGSAARSRIKKTAQLALSGLEWLGLRLFRLKPVGQ